MRALTLHRPWPWAILHAGKRFENRSWEPKLEIGEIFAIHAGATYDMSAATWMIRYMNVPPALPDADPVGIVALARYGGITVESDSPWFFGPLAWKLTEVWPVNPPIAVPGQQKLWYVHDDIAERLLKIVHEWTPIQPRPFVDSTSY